MRKGRATVVEYVVYRHGSNTANQPMTQSMPIGVYQGWGATAADRRADALRQAEREHTVYTNQSLTVAPAASTSVADFNAAVEYQITVDGLEA